MVYYKSNDEKAIYKIALRSILKISKIENKIIISKCAKTEIYHKNISQNNIQITKEEFYLLLNK